MGWWIVGSITTIIVLGYVAAKYPATFSKIIGSGGTAAAWIVTTVKGWFAPKA